MFFFKSFASLLSFILAAKASIGPVADLTVANKVLSPDGFSRDTVVVNGQFPGPLIVGKKGDEFQLNVYDRLKDNALDTVTSIHWHGLFQHGSQHADGPAFVTQCPIVPGESFPYQFSVPDQAGTYWYHSHYKNQYCDGLRGPIVIYDPKDPYAHLYDYDDESTVITVADWYHYLSTEAPPGAPKPSTALINGKGRTVGGTATDLTIVNVKYGKRYRFRLVSISCDSNFQFSIDQHKFTVIEVDGTNHEPLVIDQVQIFAGQRYSLVMTANQPVGNYWIRADGNNIVGSLNDTDGISKAILRYVGASIQEPTSNTSVQLPLNEQDLHPLVDPAAPGSPGVNASDVLSIPLDISFLGGLFEINDVAFMSPDVPVLLQILSGAPADQLMPNGSVYSIPKNQAIELVITDEMSAAVAGPHPIHLHGHVFSVVKSAGNATFNYANPPKRDVVNLGNIPGDSVVIRFTTDNPGPWFLHCHIDWHLNAGFAAVFVEDIDGIRQTDRPPQAWDQLCPNYNKFIGANSTAT